MHRDLHQPSFRWPNKALSRIFLFCLIFLIGGGNGAAWCDPFSVKIEVTGAVVPRCSNAGFDFPLQLGNLSGAGASTLQFEVDCNAPFEYRLQSENGAFRLANRLSRGTNLAAEIPYAVSVHIPLDSGRAIDDICSSASIRKEAVSCRFSNSGNSVSIRKQGQIKLAWDASPKPLVAGNYQDRLILSFSLRQ